MSRLNVSDVCAIIEKCSANGVSRLKFGMLELEFAISVATSRKEDPAPPIEDPSQGPEKEVQTISPELLKQIEEDMKQNELADMLVIDPAQFEELLFSGELENEDRRTDPTL